MTFLPAKKILTYFLLMIVGCILTLSIGLSSLIHPVVAQKSLQPEEVAAMIYEKFPEIPLENQYTRQESGEIDPDHTLMSRFVRYHRDVQKRIMRYRFDWKLTFADYLGVNEPIKPERYPGYNTLTENPTENDIKAIRQLNRRQRQEIVDLLASIYEVETAPSQEMPQVPPNSANTENNVPEPEPSPSKPSLSQPGDAQLLMP
jgi:hypothetical protein